MTSIPIITFTIMTGFRFIMCFQDNIGIKGGNAKIQSNYFSFL